MRGCETDGSSTYDCGYCVAVRLMSEVATGWCRSVCRVAVG